MDIIEFAKTTKDVLRPFGDIEVLLYYAAVSKKLAKYLEGKEIASKNWLGKKGFLPTLIKRGSKLEPLYINEFSEITHDF
ncbi:hypothetical protein KKC91_02740, partial [bacterium]|nr:hypothetical protein [bacterium]